MRSLSPDPQRADGDVDDEPGEDADEVREQVEQAEPGEQRDDGDVERQRAEGDQVEVDEPARRQAHGAEGPHLVQDVVVRGRRLHGDQGRRQQGHPGPSVQGGENRVVDGYTARADGEEAAYPRR
jgi:hypothetical protein